MKNVPVVLRDVPEKSAVKTQQRVASLAADLRSSLPALAELPLPCISQSALDSWPRLLLEDASSVREPELLHDSTAYLDRARLRAGDQDLVICPNPVPAEYEEYCDAQLGLGSVEWIHPTGPGDRRHVADYLRSDASAWEQTLEWARNKPGVVLDPYLSNSKIWELARDLAVAAGIDTAVLGSPPELTNWVNNKARFTEIVWKLLGTDATPASWIESDLDRIASRVKKLLAGGRRVVVKTPDSAGGAGNVVLRSSVWKFLTSRQLREQLAEGLRKRLWGPGLPVVISAWESSILSCPSVQIWVPPTGDPIVEGVFEQHVIGLHGEFAGSQPAWLPPDVHQQIVNQSWLLARLFQELGYLGRCSFDLLVTGKKMSRSKSLFVECNGRWGGTSLPMTLMNRVFAGWNEIYYAVRPFRIPQLGRLGFGGLLKAFGKRLFDRRTGRGHLILFNPTRLDLGLGIEVIVTATSRLLAENRLFRAGQLLGWFASTEARRIRVE